MRGINGADVFTYFKPLITKQIRQNRSSRRAKKNEKNHFTTSVNELSFCLLHNALIEKKLSFSFSEVQDLGSN